MPAAGAKGAPKNHGELKDDTTSSREEKQVKFDDCLKLSFNCKYIYQFICCIPSLFKM